MRRFGPFLFVALLLGTAGVVRLYVVQKQKQADSTPQAPAPLPTSLNASATDWRWAHTVGNRTIVEVRARNFQQVKEPALFELDDVELHLFRGDGDKFDNVRSAKAQFSIADGKLFSAGQVDIAMGLPSDALKASGGKASGRLLNIRSSGVSFESKTGKASTDRAATFQFDSGDGESVGATYDPTTRELYLKSKVRLTWRGSDPSAAPMIVEAGELTWKEGENKVFLSPWSRFRRADLTMDAASSVILLEEGEIRLVDSQKAAGVDLMPSRRLEYSADTLQMIFGPKARMEKITGTKSAKLVSLSEQSKMTMNTDRVDLSFTDVEGAATLSKAYAMGNSVVEAVPVAKAGVPMPETRILRSDTIELTMRGGGKEIEKVQTHSPGTIDFLPNRPGQRKRRLDGERMWIDYGANNEIENFRSVKVKTRTEADPSRIHAKKGAPPAPPALTWSEDLTAHFDPKTSQMTKLEQWNKFRYEEGGRKATAERATLDQMKEEITLTGKARMWDPAGSTDAERIVIDQKTNEFQAQGNVRSVREAETKPAASVAVQAGEPIRATAERMVSRDQNRQIRYDGSAVLWQGANRVAGNRIDIDRTAQQLRATGSVVHQMQERAASGLTVVKAPSLLYSDKDRVAFYEGGVVLNRPGLEVKSQKLRGYMAEENAEANAEMPSGGLDRAFADGSVAITQIAEDRVRQGFAEHCEYYVTDGKIILEGGAPQFTETPKGMKPNITRGRKLTWFANNDRLLVDGAAAQPAVTNLRRKSKK